MSLLTSNSGGILTPEEVSELVVQPLTQRSVCLQTTTVVPMTTSHEVRVPIVTQDVQASWTPEGQEIDLSDPSVTSITITPLKLAALTTVTSELAEDSSPEATRLVMDSVTRDLQLKLDAAFLGSTVSDGPDGIESITATAVPSNGFVNLDPFFAAQSAAEALGATITAWITSPATALTLAELKTDSTDSNQPLLLASSDAATGRPQRTIGGVQLWVSRGCADGVVWGFDRSRVVVGLRRDADVRVSDQALFSSDSLLVRATLRISWGFAHEASVMKIGPSGS